MTMQTAAIEHAQMALEPYSVESCPRAALVSLLADLEQWADSHAYRWGDVLTCAHQCSTADTEPASVGTQPGELLVSP